MAGLERPPVSPEAQAQMGPPGGPNFGPGIGQAQQQMEKSPAEIALGTVEKILMGVQDNTFRPYVERALGILKVGVAMAKQNGPQSPGMNAPPNMMGGGQQPPQAPPTPGQMPG